MTTYGKTKESLHAHKLAPKKKFGQNFLVHKQTAEKIVHLGRLDKDDTVIEVGVGLGALTKPLAETVKQVIGVEIDSGIIRFHEEENDLPQNVTLIHHDILKSDFKQLTEQAGSQKLTIMANLPYSISNPFIFKLIENRQRVDSATIMLQKEVGDRLVAEVGSKDYGIPTILLKACATTTRLMILKPDQFHPRPKIDSVVVRIDFSKPQLNEKNIEIELFTKIVRAAFSQRRKTLLNTLSSGDFFQGHQPLSKGDKKQLIERLIIKSGFDPKVRAETLDLQNFASLTAVFSSYRDEHQ